MAAEDINTRSSRALEWDRLKENLALEAVSDWGRELCLELEPEKDRTTVEGLLQETNEALSLREAATIYKLDHLPDVRDTLKRLAAAASLSASELHDLKLVLGLSGQCRKSLFLLEKEDFPGLSNYSARLVSIPDLFDAIDNAVEENGEIKPDASETLIGLRQEVRSIDASIRSKLNKVIQSASRALQEPLFTQRNHRYVLPVISGMRQSVKGIVHDSSASGLTVYIEPIEIVELANKLRLKHSEIDREIQKILAQLSSQAHECLEQIKTTYRTLVDLDVISARASFAQKYRGICPRIKDDGSMHLLKARHPLLWLKNLSGEEQTVSQVVPNDIEIGGEFNTLIVTGPNTGGKTVFLKTAGLLSLMARAGLLIPAAPGSSLSVYPKVYADIGDEQSIEQNLSTFSSHMTSLVDITEGADGQSLVLLDEIGAGTDPREGAAIASAILQHLHSAGAKTISTTHYGELKTLAYTKEGFMNASFEFDEETLSPTYSLNLGMPGSSKGTTIASRLGLKPEIVVAAEKLVEAEHTDLEKTVRMLEEKMADLAVKQEEAERALASGEKMEIEASQKLAGLKDGRERMRREIAGRMEDEFRRARQSLNALIAQLQKEPKLADVQKAKERMEEIRRDLDWLEAEHSPVSITEVSPGQNVLVRSFGQMAVVEESPEHAERGPDAVVAVRIGNIRVKVPVSDLEVVQAPAKKGQKRQQPAFKQGRTRKRKLAPPVETTHAPFLRSDSNSLDIRGKRVDEAMPELESFLDSAMAEGSGPVMIIHGHGTGALKNAVREYLSSCPYAITFRPGEQNEGGQGVTIVQPD